MRDTNAANFFVALTVLYLHLYGDFIDRYYDKRYLVVVTKIRLIIRSLLGQLDVAVKSFVAESMMCPSLYQNSLKRY